MKLHLKLYRNKSGRCQPQFSKLMLSLVTVTIPQLHSNCIQLEGKYLSQMLQLQGKCIYYHNVPKVSPPSKIRPPPFLLLRRVLFCRKYTHYLCHSICCYVKQEAPKKQDSAREGTNKCRQTRFAIIGIKELLHAQITRARLTACEVGIFREKYHNSRKYTHPPL